MYSQGKRWVRAIMADVFKTLKGIVRVDVNMTPRDTDGDSR